MNEPTTEPGWTCIGVKEHNGERWERRPCGAPVVKAERGDDGEWWAWCASCWAEEEADRDNYDIQMRQAEDADFLRTLSPNDLPWLEPADYYVKEE